ncbi:galactokinase galactose-binding signature family protein, partial [Vibrio parahaemolyticus VPTS-2010]
SLLGRIFQSAATYLKARV